MASATATQLAFVCVEGMDILPTGFISQSTSFSAYSPRSLDKRSAVRESTSRREAPQDKAFLLRKVARRRRVGRSHDRDRDSKHYFLPTLRTDSLRHAASAARHLPQRGRPTRIGRSERSEPPRRNLKVPEIVGANGVRPPLMEDHLGARANTVRPYCGTARLTFGTLRHAPGTSKDVPGTFKNAPGISKNAPGTSKNAPGTSRGAPGSSRHTPKIARHPSGAVKLQQETPGLTSGNAGFGLNPGEC
jgi:hypothetical protein